jgi:type I restriction enzyme, S subunit
MSNNGYKTKLSNIAIVIQGQSPDSDYYDEFEGIPFLQGNRTFGNLFPTFDTYTKKVTKIAHKDDVLMSVRAPVGDLNIAPCDLCIGRGLASIKAKNGNNKFIYYALKYNVPNLLKQGAATTFDSVNKDIINDFEIIIPENEISQKKVEVVLSLLDSKIELNNRINTELESLAKTIYNYWFVQFDFPDANGKPYKTSGGKMVWNKELKREVPEGWLNGTLTDISELIRGVTYDSKDIKQENDKGVIPVLRATNITGNVIDLENMVFVSETKVSPKQLLKKYDILIVMSSGSIDHIGKNGFFYFDEEVAFGAFCAKLVAKVEYQFYLSSYTQSDFMFTTLKNECLGTNINNLNSTLINGFKIIIPPIDLLKRFNEKVSSLYGMIGNNIIQNKKLSGLRDWLLPMLMNGQVRVG